MNETEFFGRREPTWQLLSRLCDQAESSPQNLGGDDLEQFVRAYRETSGDLARVQSESANADLERFLNNLVGRAYGILYRRPRQLVGTAILSALTTVAQTVRRRTAYISAAFAIFFAGIIFSAWVMQARPDLRSYLVQPSFEPVFAKWRSGQHDDRNGSESLGMMGFYATNNPMVSIIAASVSAGTFGLGTVALMWGNGTMLGALAQDTARVGHLDHLLVSIAPHGASELTGMVMAGASGLLLGAALVFPGRRSRGAALREHGRDAFTLMGLAVTMMMIAAPFEAFFSFNPQVPAPLKLVMAALVFGAWMAFFVGYARTPS